MQIAPEIPRVASRPATRAAPVRHLCLLLSQLPMHCEIVLVSFIFILYSCPHAAITCRVSARIIVAMTVIFWSYVFLVITVAVNYRRVLYLLHADIVVHIDRRARTPS